MDRRVGGGLMLLLALLAALVVPQVLNPPGINGAASMPPPPPPPAVGSCLKDTSTGYAIDADGVLEQAQPVQVVSCTSSHGSEVLFIDPDVTPAKVPSGGPTELDTVMDDCMVSSQGGWSYLGLDRPWSEYPPPGEWSPSAAFGVGMVGPDSDERAQGARWVACVIALPGQMLAVPLQGIVARSGGIPPELASCSVHTPGTVHVMEAGIACTQPHSMELLGEASISDHFSGQPAATPVSRADLTTGCRALAAAATGRLLVDEPSLSVQVFVYNVAAGGLPVVETGEIPPDARGWAECVITPADPGRKLAGSLRLIGENPLPWQA